MRRSGKQGRRKPRKVQSFSRPNPAESNAADRIWKMRVDTGFSNANSLVTSMPIASAEDRKAY